MDKKTKLLDLVPPGEILLEEFMKPAGVSINRLARDIDVPAGRISEIVNGKRAITADTALRLGKYFGVSPEVWMNLQTDYDLRVARRTTWPKMESRIRTHAA
jgi:addiction module HigA family antidote